MSAGWRDTRAAIERGTSVTPELQVSWLKRFDAIRSTGNSSVCRSLDELEGELNAHAAAVSGISEDLRKAAESRQTSPLTQAVPELTLFRRTILPSIIPHPELTLRPSRRDGGPLPTEMWPGVRETNRRAGDLQRIHDRIMQTVSVPVQKSFGWIILLDEIDKRGNRAAGPSAVERIEALVSEIDAVAADLRSVAATLGCHASRCRLFWRP